MRISSDRLIAALLSNLDTWIEDVAEIEENANPGNKRRAIHLQRNMLQTKLALRRMIGEEPEQ